MRCDICHEQADNVGAESELLDWVVCDVCIMKGRSRSMTDSERVLVDMLERINQIETILERNGITDEGI